MHTALIAVLALAADDIKWQTDVNSALQQARQHCKPVVILFGVGGNGGSC